MECREEFEEHGLNNVRLQHRNVCKDGFGDDITDAESSELLNFVEVSVRIR